MRLAILSHVLEHITNTCLGFKRRNLGFTHKGIPTTGLIENLTLPKVTNLPPIKRAVKKDSMIVHAVSRMAATLGSRLAVGKLNNEKIGELYLAIPIALSNRVLIAKARMFAETVDKLTNGNIRFFLSLFINLRFECKSTEKALFRLQVQTLHNMVSTGEPLLLAFL